MKAYIVVNFLGVFAIDDRGSIIDSILFPKDPEIISEKLLSDKLTNEEKELLEKLKKKGIKEFVLSKRSDTYIYEPNNFGEQVFRKKFREFAYRMKISNSQLNKLLTDIGIEFTRKKIKITVKKDRIIMEVIDAIDEIDKSVNIFSARLREWYGLHFPELDRLIDKHEKYSKLIATHGLRDKVKDYYNLAKESMGIDLSEPDEKILKEYASNIVDLYQLREDLEKYLNQLMKTIAPNFAELAGSLLGAKLIALAGGLEKLAKKPSSTIQLLGAEKSLFRYLRGKGKSPRHGILFIHPLIQHAPDKLRGKIARILASKLSIAIKIDYYSGIDKSAELKNALEQRVKEILESG